MRSATGWLVAAVLLLGAAPEAKDRGPDGIDVSGYPEKYQALYQVFEVRCSKCHSLARPVNARLRPEEWRRYVKKMERRPGSGISPETGEKIYEFLRYYTQVRDGDAASVP